ncbi:hypothetical protein NM688_g7204 [Phlebia brevispora]|uniref:Uncharacterized protein n=1 Tax=Phlebia brevispora TaxID=194682 RepID=A0ACC1S851_9APHY|nr:hypothetical protein NM688_g7204 [Phlebia brevispora]
MAKKKGPPYEDDPECQYVVIDTPWPDNRSGKDREPVFFNLLSLWLSLMLSPRVWPEEVYYVSTVGLHAAIHAFSWDVIAKFPQGVDLGPIFGEHRWPDILEGDVPNKRSFIFPYNYRRLGHPAEHNWTTHAPAGDPPPHFGRPPFRQPYPPGLYADHREKSCSSLALPMPEPAPVPKADEKGDVERKEDTPLSLAEERKEDRPSHYALAHHLTDDAPAPIEPPEEEKPEVELEQETHQPSSRLFVSKLDPYDEEDAATQFLKAELQDAVLSHVKAEVKAEEIPHNASPALLDTLRRYEEMLQREQAGAHEDRAVTKQEPGTVKQEPRAVKREPGSEAFQASDALIAAVLEHELQLARERAEMEEAQLRAAGRDRAPGSGLPVKSEPQDGRSLPRPAYNGSDPRTKPEQRAAALPLPAVSRDPRIRDPRLAASSSTKRVKTEDNGVPLKYAKKPRY